MYERIEQLSTFSFVKEVQVLKFKDDGPLKVLEAKVTLKDESVLYIREKIWQDNFRYSYHWQDKNGDLVIRWDNKPHHRFIETYPRHKHIRKKGQVEITVSPRISVDEVVREIQQSLKSKH
jgi:hypothetical protein